MLLILPVATIRNMRCSGQKESAACANNAPGLVGILGAWLEASLVAVSCVGIFLAFQHNLALRRSGDSPSQVISGFIVGGGG